MTNEEKPPLPPPPPPIRLVKGSVVKVEKPVSPPTPVVPPSGKKKQKGRPLR